MGISSSQDRGLELELGQHQGSLGCSKAWAPPPRKIPELPGICGGNWGILGSWDPPGGGSEGEGPFLGEFPGTSGPFRVTAAFVTSSSSSS